MNIWYEYVCECVGIFAGKIITTQYCVCRTFAIQAYFKFNTIIVKFVVLVYACVKVTLTVCNITRHNQKFTVEWEAYEFIWLLIKYSPYTGTGTCVVIWH